jgi:capsid protein
MRAHSPIVDQFGRPLRRQREINARYDAAQTTDEFKNYWANADRLDADSAHSREVRHTLVSRLRYEVANNGYADGIAQTYATDLVGVGPLLRMKTGSNGFNQMIEREWYFWTKAVQLRRKLWCMAHAKHMDGEGIGVMRLNRKVKHTVKLDVVLYETEQCQTPYIPFDVEGYIDGIKFDEFGNPQWYDILREHPGSSGMRMAFTPERVPADKVLHWFKMRRPGQHRGVPESASTLNLGAAARRWREATIAAAETAADFAVLLKTQQLPDVEFDPVTGSFPISKRMMVTLPDGYDATQLRAEHPASTYEVFHKQLVNEQARPKSMPYNKAACDSSSYNYASGRLDHQTYYGELDVDREDGNDLVLDKLFDEWLNLAILSFGWLGGNPDTVGASARFHLWDWPRHRVADVEAEANANQTKLKSGQIGLHRLYTDAGLDLDDEIPEMARTFGVGESEIRKRLLDVLLPPVAQPQIQQSDEDFVDAVMKRIRNGHNGHVYAG